MTPRGARERPAAVFGLGLAFGLLLASAAVAPAPASAAPPASGRSPRVPTLYHKSRSFRIPFNVDPADRPRLKEVQLWVSEDSGFTWTTVSRTTPDRPAFTFRARRDAEYWFAVRTLDQKGVLYPGEDEKVEPSMKVVVDTSPPSLVVEPDGRRGSVASVRWEVKDEHLDLKSLVLEYQVEGGRDWRVVPVRRPGLIGSESWDAGTAEPLKVRAAVSDKAGNVAEAVISLSEGTPGNPGLASAEPPDLAAPPISQISSGPTFPPRDEPGRAPVPSPTNDPFPFPPSEPVPGASAPSPSPSPPPYGNEGDPFGGSGTVSGAEPAAPAAAPDPVAEGANGQSLLVPSPRFPLQYAVEDAGPDGPASVELWVTQNGGRTWFRKGEDPDRASPFPVDLGGEGTYGLRVVARSASGLGDSPPAPGDAPHLTVEVDSTPPLVQLIPPAVGGGPNVGKVAIRWTASDLHLGPKPVALSWRPDQPGARWQPITPGPVENTGKFIWTVPANVPPRIHLRVDVVDTAGNRGYAETTEGSPVLVDRTRPRGRIIGLDPSARTGMGAARPLR